MSFFKNIFVIAKSSYSGFTNDIELKAKAIEVTNQEKKAKAEALQIKIKQAELEKIAKVEALQNKIEQAELVKKNNQNNIKNIIATGDLELVKTTIGSKEDALKFLNDDEFLDVLVKSSPEKGTEEFAIDFYVNHAKLYNQYEVMNYLSTLQ